MNELVDFGGLRGLDKNCVVRRYAARWVLMRLERREVEIRGKATAKALTQRARRKAQRARRKIE
jgi:hypothetical protein